MAEKDYALSVLDLSPVSTGSTSAQALRNAVDLAQLGAVAAGFPTFAATPTNNVTSDSNYVGVSDMLQEYVYGASNVQTRLGYWRFDNPYLYSEQGQLPLAVSNISLVPGWSDTALNVGGSSSSGVTYADVGTNGWANFNCRQGSLRFWFKPNPGAGGRLGAIAFLGTGTGRDGRTSFADPDYKDYGPRFGFAYEVRSGTVIRGGYGLYISALPMRSPATSRQRSSETKTI